MRAINFVIAAFLFFIGYFSLAGVVAASVAAFVLVALEKLGSPPILPDGVLIAMVIPVTFGTYIAFSAMDYAKHLIKNHFREA